jgi:membrane-bound lytic murein transglycosylase D
MDMIHRILAEEGVPLDLGYIPHVESAFKPKALSRVRAYGLWQFMAATGRNYGLQIDYWVDERADAEKATRAAARYLKFLYGMFGDWNLAMASYNAGEYKVQRGLKRSGADDFWELARTRYLRRETKNFVPAILAAIVIYRNPEKYGFDPATRATPWEYEEIQVDGPVDLMVLAECAGSDLHTLRNLNPELRRNTVFPEATAYRLRVPPGRGQAALARLAEIPPGQRIRQVEHVLQRGETLSLLASKYGTSVRAIQTANNIRDPRRVRAGSRLVVPLTDGVYAAKWLTSTEVNASGLKVYTVRPGDNPYRIARRHRISMDRLLRWNGMTKRSVIHPGDRLYLEDPGSARARNRSASKRSSSRAPRVTASGAETVYVVRRGDTLGRIASRHGVELNDVLSWNGLGMRSIIRPGDRLVLRTDHGSRPIPASRTTSRAPDGSYVVRSGDTLYDIARAHRVALDDLLAWNDLGKRSVIHPGQRLVLAGDEGAGDANEGWGEPMVYVVRRGDTLYEISRNHSVSVTDLCRWNGISKRKVLHPGDRLTVYTR